MKAKLLATTLAFALFAVACAENAGATDPADGGATDTVVPDPDAVITEPTATRQSDSDQQLARVNETVQAAIASPTARRSATREPAPTVSSRPVNGAPSPQPTVVRRPTATPVRVQPPATQTVPVSIPTPAVLPTASPVISPTVSASPGEIFQSVLNYQYDVPSTWTERTTDSALIISDSSGRITVTVTERPFDRWRYQTVISLGASTFPERPAGWNLWSNISVGIIKANTAYEYQFRGEKYGQPYLHFVHWYAWGDMLVEVSTEVPAFDWDSSLNIRGAVQTVTGSFSPHDGTNLLTADDVLAALYVRLDDRPSGVYDRNEELRQRFELTCRDIYNNLLREPEYLGQGLWQVSALTLQGLETWWVFEPGASIMTLNSNQSRC